MKKLLLVLIIPLLMGAACTTDTSEPENIEPISPPVQEVSSTTPPSSPPGGPYDEWKPVIYLYPTQAQNIDVQLNYQGTFTVTYPEYENGWNVFAYPDSKIINLKDNREYSYLFWEGESNKDVDYDLSTGFVVSGEETVFFLQEKLAEIGLTPKEYNEFIVYWLPQLLNNKYNLVHFATKEEYHDRAELDIDPKPDSVLRVFVVFKSLDEMVELQPQTIETFNREGFAVVEWGGTILK
ncbi:hypothetical protein HON36_00755 [Candidatus Parcubacteria bacterium]|jgi:hypothetical protein|nr:hypothetical protein [Candidatus Parcubacteria bacterium]